MSTRKPISVARLLDRVGSSGIHQLTDRGQRLARFERFLNEQLPPELIGRVRIGNLRDQLLILFVDSPAWAARLRFHVPQLLQQLRKHGAIRPEKIQIRVLPDRSPPPVKHHHARMSAAAAESIRITARCTEDSKLAAALERLASRGKPD